MAGNESKLTEGFYLSPCACDPSPCATSQLQQRLLHAGEVVLRGSSWRLLQTSARSRVTARCRSRTSSHGCSAPPGTAAQPRGRCSGPPLSRATAAAKKTGETVTRFRWGLWGGREGGECGACARLIFCRDKEETDMCRPAPVRTTGFQFFRAWVVVTRP